MRLITPEDFTDIYIKLHQRGWPFLLSKINLSAARRTQSAFNDSTLESSSFWTVPEVRKRWNRLITGDENTLYEEYLTKKFLADQRGWKMLAIGTGVSSHELRLAELNPELQIDCFDFSDELLAQAERLATEKNLSNIRFFPENILEKKFSEQCYDAVFFHASLHHFDRLPEFLNNVVIKNLKPRGYLIINEFVGANRLQYSKIQLEYINRALKLIPKKYRKIFKTPLYKNRYYGSGVLRMIIADPSECVDSAAILPAIHEKFDVIEEKFYGNNILQSALKDISHHFVQADEERLQILHDLFALEDELLKTEASDFVFGVYRLKS